MIQSSLFRQRFVVFALKFLTLAFCGMGFSGMTGCERENPSTHQNIEAPKEATKVIPPDPGKKASDSGLIKDRSELKFDREQQIYRFDQEPYTGVAERKNKEGILTQRYEYVNGVLHGTIREFSEKGVLQVESEFWMGERHGMNRYWDAEGNPMKEQKFEHGKMIDEKLFEAKETQ